MFLANNLNKGGSLGGYQISRSLRFNSADSAYLNRTPASATNRTTWTWSGWVKRSSFGTDQQLFSAGGSGAFQFLYQTSTDCLYIYDSVSSTTAVITTQVFRDPSAWYHVVLATDTTQATASNRFKLYINGSQVTSFGTATYPAQNSTLSVNNTVNHSVGSWSGSGGGNFFSGYMTEVNFIDGQALTPSSFGETNAQTGVWQPKAYSGSYGTNGFYLNFSDNSNTTAATLGKDYSGNGNNWTPNNFSVTAGAGNDSLVDSPTSYGTDTGVGGTVRGNYCTINPLYGSPAPTNGNLDITLVSQTVYGSMSFTSGKWYWETTATNLVADFYLGVMDSTFIKTDSTWGVGTSATYVSNGTKYGMGGSSTYGASYTTGDVIGFALDLDAGTMVFYKNGVSQGTAFTGMTGREWRPMLYSGNGSLVANFGQRPFAYTAPSGYKALCTQNLPTPTIGATSTTLATKYFNPVLYTGTGANLSVTGVGFQPDLTWVKGRSAAYSHGVNDAVRGAGATLVTNDTAAEYAYSAYFTGFTSDGFNLGSGSSVFNFASSTYVAWNWKANGSGSTNTAGSITSTVSANTTSGFSVVTYTGTGGAATVGHGLGVAPSMFIVKVRNDTNNWPVYHKDVGATNWILLNTTGASASNSAAWNNTAPTSTVFTVGTSGATNQGSMTYVAYCFSEVAGYSKFGSYTGNGSADGPFVFTGMRPAYVMVKRTDTTDQWSIYDGARNPNNLTNILLYANLSNADDVGAAGIDMLSNGIKMRNTYSNLNASGGTYIFMAFASNPFKYSLAR